MEAITVITKSAEKNMRRLKKHGHAYQKETS